MIWTVAKKELRGYFNSAVAVIFLGVFLAFTLGMFFGVEKFFARGLADLRPLFKGMPLLFIILVSALSMRQWSDERRTGTLEVLLTLPVQRWKLVAGKFVAGMLLIAIALGLTLGLPITIAQMGNLDTGPVLGGYLAALLLAGAYLAIGMCVSAATDNQIVAFFGTALVCLLTYAVAFLAGVFGLDELGRFLGTGARFESVARGVLDLRDLVYYGSIIVVGVSLNVLLLGIPTWGRGSRARPRRIGAILTVALIAANALAVNAWLAPTRRARLDMTEDRMYSLSPTTRNLIRSLEEPMAIRGYFSEKTHPWLAPLIPQIRDLLDEYRVAGGSKLSVSVVDPVSDELKVEAKDRYGIASTPLPFTTQTEQSVVNSYFAIAIAYGDQHVVLGIDDLIQVRAHDMTNVEVTLRNLEYQVTKSMKKVIAEFASVDTMFASAPQPIRLIAYITPSTLPESLKEAPDKLKKVADELAKDARGKLTYTVIEPKFASQPTDPAARAEAEEIRRKHGARPIQLLGSDQLFYFYLVAELASGPRFIELPKEIGEAPIKTAIVDALKRGSPGFRKIVGLWTPPEGDPMFAQGMGMPQQRMPPAQSFQELQKALAEGYEVRSVDLAAKVPSDVEVLVLAGPSSLDAKAAEHVDQFVMRGGSLVLLHGGHRLALDFFRRGPKIEQVTTGLEAVLEKWGIKIADQAVADTRSESFLIEQERPLGGGLVALEHAKKPYVLLPRIASDQLAPSAITGGLPGAVMALASPVSAEGKVGDDERRVEVLLRSSGEAWLTRAPALPDWQTHPDGGFPGPAPGDERRAQALALTVTGAFPSGVAKAGAAGEAAGEAAEPRLLEHSPGDTRIVVFGSSTFVSDLLIRQPLGSDLVRANIQLVHNAIDWALSDTDLLAIRARTPAARAITLEESKRGLWIFLNFAIAFFALGAVVGLAWLRRYSVKPFLTGKEV